MKYFVAMLLPFLLATLVRAEPYDSQETLTNVEAMVQLKLEQFAKTNTDYQLLLDARTITASMGPRGNRTNLCELDADRLRLQLKVLLAVAAARDRHFDPNAGTNIPSIELAPPGGMYPSGIDPSAIKEPEVRKAYEEALANNNRRLEKLNREMSLSRCEDFAILDVWVFVKNLPENSPARKSALAIIGNAVSDISILARIKSNSMPHLTW